MQFSQIHTSLNQGLWPQLMHDKVFIEGRNWAVQNLLNYFWAHINRCFVDIVADTNKTSSLFTLYLGVAKKAVEKPKPVLQAHD